MQISAQTPLESHYGLQQPIEACMEQKCRGSKFLAFYIRVKGEVFIYKIKVGGRKKIEKN